MCSRKLKISVALILVLIPLITSLPHHNLSKRSSFFDLECKGVYNKSIFFRLDRICEDCYQLFREITLHQLCKKQCFTTDYFKGCLEALHLDDEIEHLKTYIRILNGGTPPSEKCFQTEFFDGCVQALQLHEEMEKYEEWRERLGKKK